MDLLKEPVKDQFGMIPYEWNIIAATRQAMALDYKRRGNTEAWENFKALKAYSFCSYTAATMRVGIMFGRVYRIQSNGWVKI